ncbi:MAG: hypothetical protein Q4C47_00720 [Planctomycetia bacterium]|nr:hypothetical protein [Planctomycetia bacterium]
MGFHSAKDIYGTVFRGETATFLARVTNESGVPLTQSDIRSIRYTVYSIDEQRPGHEVVVSGHMDITVPIITSISDTLQTGEIWTVDNTGYNFRHTPSDSESEIFPVSNHTYLVEYQIVPTTGLPVTVRFRVQSI